MNDQLSEDLRLLQDKVAIRDLLDGYFDAIARRDWDALAATFTPDGAWRLEGAANMQFETRDSVKAGMSKLVEATELAILMNHSSVIEISGDRAKARTLCHEITRRAGVAQAGFLLGFYHDELVRSDGQWLFARKTFRIVHRETG